MANVVLQPASDGASKANLLKTVFEPVSLEAISALLRPSDRNALELLGDSGLVSFWGAKPGEDGRNVKRWNRIAPGDSILFALGNGRALIARITYKIHNKPLAEDLWGMTSTANGFAQTWEYMFAVDAIDEQRYDKSELNMAIGRKPNADIREFTVLSPEASLGAIAYFKIPASAASPSRIPATAPLKKKVAQADIEQLDILDAFAIKRRRLEQRLLRDYLLPEETGTCAMCGRTFPIQFLVAAHVKARSKCTDREKRDIENIAMPNCRFGCDELYERGYVAIDSTGRTIASSKTPEVGPVRAYILEHLLDQPNSFWTEREGSRPYFAFHAAKVFVS